MKVKTPSYEIYRGDCLELLATIPERSVDMVLCDLPYGLTSCDWDVPIDMETLWKEYQRVLSPCGVIALFGVEPFSSRLRMSNLADYKYDWIWNKKNGANFLTAKKQPLRIHENISVFYKTKVDAEENFRPIKDYLRAEREESGLKQKEINELLGNQMFRHYASDSQFTFIPEHDYLKLQKTGFFRKDYQLLKTEYESEKERVGRNTYNPQLGSGKPYKRTSKQSYPRFAGAGRMSKSEIVLENNDGTRYPNSIITFPKDGGGYHPTQKPVALLEYLIKTYTNEGEIVLDNCMGSGSTGVACLNTKRYFIGMEKEEGYFDIALERLGEAAECLKSEITNDARVYLGGNVNEG